jgi:glycosyltransferase involved in cell wall biosynthesis
MFRPLVSALIAAYNNERTIGAAIDSLLAQRVSESEVIVVDDGSIDNTEAIVKSYGLKVRFLRQANAGSAAARNAGIRASEAKYIAFLDGDDVAVPNRLELQVAAMESRPEVGLTYGNIFLMRADGGQLRLRRGVRRYQSGKVTRELAIKNFVPFSTIMLRRDLLMDIGLFDESIRSSEDWDMLVRLSRHCEFLYIDQPLVKYRIGLGSKTSNIEEKERAYKRVQTRIFAENDFGADSCRLRRLSNAALEFGLLSIALRYGRYRTALRHLARGLRAGPDIVFHYRHEIWSRLMTSLGPGGSHS